jgi:hypothetical protein
MDQGKVVEVGSPLDLLRESVADIGENAKKVGGMQTTVLMSGIFRGLVNELGPERRERFISIAEKKKEKLKMQLG